MEFEARYGVKPYFILQETWFKEDTTISTEQALGKHGWFKPVGNDINSIHSIREYNDMTFAVSTPGFRR